MVDKLKWLGKDQRTFLERGYLKRDVLPEDRYDKIADTIQSFCNTNKVVVNNIDEVNSEFNYTTDGIGNRFREYTEKNWVSYASPILSNFGEVNLLPISCNHGKIPDSLDGIYKGLHEMAMLAKNGAGTAKNFSNIRPIGEEISTGGKSEGIMPWIETYADSIGKITQGSVRRGFLTAYLSVSHPEILEFLDIGGKGHKIQNITTAVTIPKGWMKDLRDGSPKNREVWAKILKVRSQIGFPYILFEENCNINSPQVYKDKDIWIDNANICIEAIEYCDEFKEFACCLSSVNAYHYDEWKDHPYFIMDMNIMLDCVITEYIIKGRNIPGLKKAIKFASEHRSIGLGVLGFHDYLQKNDIVFGSLGSYQFNHSVFSNLRSVGDKASKYMAKIWGEPEFMKGTGFRNSSRMAQAPTKSTSFIMNARSSGVEPIKSNFHEKTLAKIQVEYKNPQLVKLLDQIGKNENEVWKSILVNNGSVQHLDFLNDHQKNVFKTFSEISQVDVIKLAGQRQKFIDMGQSINIMIHPETPSKDVNMLHLMAFDEGLKSLYYQYSINAAQAFNQELMTCSSCEG